MFEPPPSSNTSFNNMDSGFNDFNVNFNDNDFDMNPGSLNDSDDFKEDN